VLGRRVCILYEFMFYIYNIFRCEEHLYTRLRPLVGPLVHPSPSMQLRGKLVTSQLLREEEKEEETDYVAIPLRRDSFAPRDWAIPLFSNIVALIMEFT
jgi:hypothetical protein